MSLLSILRYMQFYVHNAHNLLGGPTFFQDHEFLGELYPVYEEAYDSVAERIIGMKGTCDLIGPTKMAAAQLEKTGPCKSYLDCYKEVIKWEGSLCTAIEKLTKESTQGELQLLGEIANQSEMRQYKLKQRVK